MRLKPAQLAVSIPLIAMVLWVVSLQAALMMAQEVILPVSGYDPRDLLSGHYLQYQVDYGISSPISAITSSPQEKFCACLEQTDGGVAKASWLGSCEERDHTRCELFIKGKIRFPSEELIAGIERYYIPERYQQVLAQVPRNGTIKVRVTSSGSAYVTGMYVDGTPILEWARARMPDY